MTIYLFWLRTISSNLAESLFSMASIILERQETFSFYVLSLFLFILMKSLALSLFFSVLESETYSYFIGTDRDKI